MFLKKIYILFLCFFIASCANIDYKYNRNASNDNVKLGLAYFNNGQRQLAKSKLLLAFEQDETNSVANDALGYFFEQTGNIVLAKKYYLNAITISNKNDIGASYNNYGSYLYRQKKYKDSIDYFLKAANSENYLHTSNAFENAGIAFESMNNYKMAKIYFNKALENDPNYTSAKIALDNISKR